MGSRYTYLLIIVALLLMPMVAGAITKPAIISEPVFKQSEDITVKLPCTINGSYCSGSAVCRTTILNPEGTILINNQAMTKNNAVFEINLTSNQTGINGEYEFNVVCADGGSSASRFLKFHITPNGEKPTSAKGILYISLLIIFVVLMILGITFGYRADHIALKVGLYLGAYLLFVGITFIAWNISADYLTSSPFLTSFFRTTWIVSMYALFPLILVLTIYTFWMLKKIDVIENMLERGMPIDEAYERQVRGGMRRKY